MMGAESRNPTAPSDAKERKAYKKWCRVHRAFQLHGENFSRVAMVACVDRTTVRIWWDRGHPSKYEWGARPMREVIEREKLEVRVAAAAPPGSPEEAAPVGAKPDLARNTSSAQKAGEVTRGPSAEAHAKHREAVIEARVQEAQAVRLSRTNALGLLGMSLNLVGAMGPLSRRVATELMNKQSLPMTQAIGYMRTVTSITSQAVEVAERAMAMERLLLTEDNPGTAAAIADAMSTEEALAELKRAKETYSRLEETGRLTLIQGGKSVTPEPLEVPEVPYIEDQVTDEGRDSGEQGSAG